MKNNLLPIFLCSLLYLASCSTKEDSVKPEKDQTQTFERRHPGSASNRSARGGYQTGVRFTTATFSARDISVGPRSGYDYLWAVSSDAKLILYSVRPSDSYFNPSSGSWNWINVGYSTSPNSILIGGLPMYNGIYPTIDVDNYGLPWVVLGNGKVYQSNYGTFSNSILLTDVTGAFAARDVACSSTGAVFVTASTGEVYKYNFSTKGWDLISGLKGARISADQLGRPWVVVDKGPLYYYDNGLWINVGNGGWRDVGAATYHQVTALGSGTTKNIFLYDFASNSWAQYWGTGFESSVDTDGEGWPYFVNPAGEIWTH